MFTVEVSEKKLSQELREMIGTRLMMTTGILIVSLGVAWTLAVSKPGVASYCFHKWQKGREKAHHLLQQILLLLIIFLY